MPVEVIVRLLPLGGVIEAQGIVSLDSSWTGRESSIVFDEDCLLGTGMRGFTDELYLIGWDVFGDR
ncbi:hypothetical protein MSAR_31000 [Mycolicibacterium sarraceniae]|uniref:Uncharacterized protein n=1 Tax=Mycolicibacterium sarraceniae TaxID=1534348 RepID=A0A7I7SSL2_9MYCO|nr:hypothetical protein MSAR_31000 [Mycolicibacterium sarraceniae]